LLKFIIFTRKQQQKQQQQHGTISYDQVTYPHTHKAAWPATIISPRPQRSSKEDGARFLQAGCHSCHPTNSVGKLKGI